MPMSEDFQTRFEATLPQIVKHFPTPFYLYDLKGIREGMERLQQAFSFVKGYRNYYAVKANPNLLLLRYLHELGCGFDCSSPIELKLARAVGVRPEEIMFTSNATPPGWFELAAEFGGCLFNFDDPTLLETAAGVIDFPKTFCCRYNPGSRRTGGFNEFIGRPERAKFGVPHEAIVGVYRRAQELGATRFILHTMVCSNERDWKNLAGTVEMLLVVVLLLKNELGIEIESINSGGGFGISYEPGQNELDLKNLTRTIHDLLEGFKTQHGFAPRIVTENGRWVTGPHGVLVTSVVGHKHGSQYGHLECVTVNAPTLSASPRTAIYGAYHDLSVCGASDRSKKEVYVVGPMCENNDYYTCDGEKPAPRLLPKTRVGDLLYVHDCGAHTRAMASNYNGGPRPAELLWHEDGRIELARPAETIESMLAEFCIDPKIVTL